MIIRTECDKSKAKNFINVLSLDKPWTIEIKEYKKRVLSWQEFLLQKKGCAYCPAWRVCIGKFSSSYEKNPGCRDFFSDVMDAADYFKMQKKQSREELWQS